MLRLGRPSVAYRSDLIFYPSIIGKGGKSTIARPTLGRPFDGFAMTALPINPVRILDGSGGSGYLFNISGAGDWMKSPRNNPSMRVYRRTENISSGNDRIDDHLRRILSLVDGQKSLAGIAFAAGMEMSDFQRAIKALIDLDLIVPLETSVTKTD
jgi:hypothetical protein